MKYIAFLRGINVGGHRMIRMSELAAIFSGLGFGGVRTFIASGNVLFDTGGSSPPSARDRRSLEGRIGRAILETFGHEVVVMIRTSKEVADLARRLPPSPRILPGQAHRGEGSDRSYVLFLAVPPPQEGVANLKALESVVDRFELLGTEVIWHCNRSRGPSRLTNVSIEKKLGVAATARDANTVRRLAALSMRRKKDTEIPPSSG